MLLITVFVAFHTQQQSTKTIIASVFRCMFHCHSIGCFVHHRGPKSCTPVHRRKNNNSAALLCMLRWQEASITAAHWWNWNLTDHPAIQVTPVYVFLTALPANEPLTQLPLPTNGAGTELPIPTPVDPVPTDGQSTSLPQTTDPATAPSPSR